MAIYVKRESAIADTIQSPDNVGNDLDQIEKDVAGPNGIASHEEEIENAVEGVIDDPAKGLMDGCEIAESAYMALYESEYNFNQIVECIDIHTLRAASMDRTLVLEAGDIKDWFNTIKEAILSAFRKFSEVITNVINKIKSIFADNAKFVQVNSQNIIDGFNKVKNMDGDFEGIGYNRTALSALADSFSNVAGFDIDAEANKARDARHGTKDDAGEVDKAFDAAKINIIKSFLKNNNVADNSITSISDVLKAIETSIVGDKKVSLKTYYADGNDVINVLKSNSAKEISGNYAQVKNKISAVIKNLESKASAAASAEKKVDADGFSANDFKFATNIVKYYQQLIQQTCILVSRLRTNEIMQARSFANKCISAAGKKYTESAVSESSVFSKIELI